MPRHIEAPTITPDRDGDTVATHPAYAQIRAGNISGQSYLYGSDFAHQHYVNIAISRSSLRRGLSNDWHHAHEELISVDLSEAQWAAFVSSMNRGGGVPCTIDHIGHQQAPGLPPPEKRTDQFAKEMRETLADVATALSELRERIGTIGLSGAKAKELLSLVGTAERNLTPNLKFVAEQFGEHMEAVVEAAKTEVNAMAMRHVIGAGHDAIARGDAPAMPAPSIAYLPE